jgi:hypothetical protein
MSNPFSVQHRVQAKDEQWERRRFKTTAYAVLLAATCFLLGMLIQGCNDQHRFAQRPEEVEIFSLD